MMDINLPSWEYPLSENQPQSETFWLENLPQNETFWSVVVGVT